MRCLSFEFNKEHDWELLADSVHALPVGPNGKEEPAVVVTSSGSKEEVRPNGNEERATVLKSSGSTEEVRSNGNEERAAVLTSSGIKETARPSGIEERAAELSSSGNKVEVMPNEIEKPAAELASSGSKHKLILARPKEPEFVTAQRVRPTRVKSSAELEEEMMAKIPKLFKILEVPTLPALPKSTPQLPEFKEFHLQTMARANQNAETSTVASIESTQIFESKGDLGMFCNTKRQVTVPQEFHFSTDERILPPANVTDELLFGKLPLNSESQNDKTIPRNTTPTPFRLSTEERGAEK
ncbi:Protein TPX2 [Capsicum baccatum]|uniref:Protein TPX2 n=1 Tax=Capsicum baccatum TaxID=33114 RepID=A0A2G2VZL9_CAPBA|nr:Protein TPX2 [Capsicum baccatum]